MRRRTYNQSKLSCTINISTPDGADLLKRLVALSDVVVENMATGTIDRLGLGYDDLRKVKPDIIMVSSSGPGHTGPDKNLVAYGSLPSALHRLERDDRGRRHRS